MKNIHDQYNVLIESRMTRLETIAESQLKLNDQFLNRFDRIEMKIDSHFRWTIGLILVSVLLPFVSAALKSTGLI